MKKLIITLLLLNAFISVAQHNHSSDEENDKPLFKNMPQHGGEIIEAGKYRLEVLINPMSIEDKLTVFVLKKNLKEVQSKDISGNVVLKFKDGRIDTVALTNDNGRMYAGKINVSLKTNMFFNLKINNKSVTGVYFNSGLIKN